MSDAYTAAHNHAVIVDRSDLGMLKVRGETRLDLLHRMSTQAINGLQRRQGVATILTSDIARIIDRLILYASSDTLYMLTGENNSDNIARYLMRFVFFNDDFHLEDVSHKTAIFGVYGAQAQTVLSSILGQDIDWPLHHWERFAWADTMVYVHRTDPIAGGGYFVMCLEQDRDVVWQKLVADGLTPIEGDLFDVLRVESKQPRFGYELTKDYIPLEADLWDDVSFTKGCYIGQEIIARMESRGRLAKKLTQFVAESALEVGADILGNGRKVGSITSAGMIPAGATNSIQAVALGYVKTNALQKEGLAFTTGGITLKVVNQT